jgi:non-ribosomal peptide synthase protein (TIGR01720 family)
MSNKWKDIESSLLTVPLLDSNLLKNALNKLIGRYENLHIRFKKDKERLLPYRGEESQSIYFENNCVRREELIHYCGQLNQKLNYETGPVCAVSLINMEGEHESFLYVALHRLIADRVAWRVFVTDLYLSYSNKELLNYSHSYKEWMYSLRAYSQELPISQNQFNFWRKIIANSQKEILPHEELNDSNEEENININFRLNFTSATIHDLAAKNTIKPDELLLCTMAYAISKIYKNKQVSILITDHGRDPIYQDIDASNIFGYCQFEFPMVCNMANNYLNEADFLNSFVQQLSSCPTNGLGYYALASAHPDSSIRSQLKLPKKPCIHFNYLGNFDQLESESEWRISSIYSGLSNGTTRREYKLSISYFFDHQQLCISCIYQSSLFTQEVIELLKLEVDYFLSVIEKLMVNQTKVWLETNTYSMTYKKEYEPLVVFSPGQSSTSTYLFLHPGGGGAESYFQALEPFSNTNYRILIFNNYLLHSGDLTRLPASFEDLAALYISFLDKYELRSSLNLVGYSFGGVLAFEMALQLEMLGIKLEGVHLIDPIFINPFLTESEKNYFLKQKRSIDFISQYEVERKPKLQSKPHFYKAGIVPCNIEGLGLGEIKMNIAAASPLNGLPFDEQDVLLHIVNCDHYSLLSQPYAGKIMRLIFGVE